MGAEGGARGTAGLEEGALRIGRASERMRAKWCTRTKVRKIGGAVFVSNWLSLSLFRLLLCALLAWLYFISHRADTHTYIQTDTPPGRPPPRRKAGHHSWVPPSADTPNTRRLAAVSSTFHYFSSIGQTRSSFGRLVSLQRAAPGGNLSLAPSDTQHTWATHTRCCTHLDELGRRGLSNSIHRLGLCAAAVA